LFVFVLVLDALFRPTPPEMILLPMKKALLVFGTRPEVMKMALLGKAFPEDKDQFV
jgi:hypothetical protein